VISGAAGAPEKKGIDLYGRVVAVRIAVIVCFFHVLQTPGTPRT